MDYKSQTCCFTGPRDIAPYTPDTVFEQTKVVITLLVTKGFKYFGTGGALGFDTIAAQAVLSVKETHPEVKLILVLPCEKQTKYWKQQDIDVYNDIKLRADKVKVLAPHYYNGCMQKRNRHLVDCSSACICFLTKHEGGTAYTVDYAKQKGLYLINVVEEIEGQPSLFLDYPFLFRHFLLCSTSLVVSHNLRKCRLLKYLFDKIIHKVLGIIIRNFGV